MPPQKVKIGDPLQVSAEKRYLEQLTKRLSDTVQILTAFLFYSLHYIALCTYDFNHVFATTKSFNC